VNDLLLAAGYVDLRLGCACRRRRVSGAHLLRDPLLRDRYRDRVAETSAIGCPSPYGFPIGLTQSIAIRIRWPMYSCCKSEMLKLSALDRAQFIDEVCNAHRSVTATFSFEVAVALGRPNSTVRGWPLVAAVHEPMTIRRYRPRVGRVMRSVIGL